jgi:ADP-heptose:LPS heptosyltransferase
MLSARDPGATESSPHPACESLRVVSRRAVVLHPLPAPLPAQRILVVRLGAMGDVVRTRFAFGGLRKLYPRARIDWLVEDRAAAGLEAIRGLDGRIVVPRSDLQRGTPASRLRRLTGVIRELRGRDYELAVDFHGMLRGALLVWAAGIPQRVGYARGVAKEGSSLLLTHPVRFAPRYVSRFERNAALVRYLGGDVPSEPPPVDLPPGRPAEIHDLAGDLAVIHPGTSASTRYKRWDPAGFAEVARALHDHAGLTSLVTWGPVPGEREVADEVVHLAKAAARLAPATRSIAQLLALIRSARVFVGCDSGPLHLASLVGVPVVAVFGPTDPIENAPFPGAPHRVVRRDVGCNPCREGCSARTCLSDIPPSSVIRAAFDVIREGAAEGGSR